MNKKIIFLVVLVLVIAGVTGLFWLVGTSIENQEKTKFEPAKNYTIKEMLDEKIVENKKAGLSFRIPLDWKIEIKEYQGEGGGPEIYTSGSEIDINTPFPKKGCAIGINVRYNKEEYEAIKLRIEEPEDKYKIVEIGEFKGIEKKFFDNSKFGIGYIIEIPAKNRIYGINKVSAPDIESREKCPGEFERFIKTISIK